MLSTVVFTVMVSLTVHCGGQLQCPLVWSVILVTSVLSVIAQCSSVLVVTVVVSCSVHCDGYLRCRLVVSCSVNFHNQSNKHDLIDLPPSLCILIDLDWHFLFLYSLMLYSLGWSVVLFTVKCSHICHCDVQ